MGLPQQLKTARMTNATVGDQIDNQVGLLELAIADILGIPVNTDINGAGFIFTAAGLTNILLQDLAGDPSAVGRLVRDGKALKYHDGNAARLLLNGFDFDISQTTLANDVGPGTMYSKTIPGGLLGTNHAVEFDTTFTVSLLANAVLTLFFRYGGTAYAQLSIIGALISPFTFHVGIKTLLAAYGATNKQFMRAIGVLSWNGAAVGSEHPGFGNADGPSSNVNFTVADPGKDSTADQTFDIRATFDFSDPGCSITDLITIARRVA